MNLFKAFQLNLDHIWDLNTYFRNRFEQQKQKLKMNQIL